ncbi:cytochrome c oxidase subunit 3 [bacterium]|nr:cytochrome c oxidase subunit 3 [bacterium]
MATHAAIEDQYFVPAPSWWPFALTAALFVLVHGIVGYLNGTGFGTIPSIVGVIGVITMVVVWFRGVIAESEGGLYGAQVDRTYRWAMGWFIFSEVMFFAAFFGALFYARMYSLPWLGGDLPATNEVLWSGFEFTWPSNGPAALGGAFETIPAWGIPFLNTCLLVASGVTFEAAHHALKEDKRGRTLAFMVATIALGAIFLFYQAEEYVEAYSHLNLTLGSGIYGSTFFMLTGFHGMHVTLGVIMLTVVTVRIAFGHFTTDRHFAFEAVGWYWHFVDVVWIGLFIFVYVV